MKIDGFGVKHQLDCVAPRWRTDRTKQRCSSCGITWKLGDPQTPPQPITWNNTKSPTRKNQA